MIRPEQVLYILSSFKSFTQLPIASAMDRGALREAIHSTQDSVDEMHFAYAIWGYKSSYSKFTKTKAQVATFVSYKMYNAKHMSDKCFYFHSLMSPWCLTFTSLVHLQWNFVKQVMLWQKDVGKMPSSIAILMGKSCNATILLPSCHSTAMEIIARKEFKFSLSILQLLLFLSCIFTQLHTLFL